MLLLVMDGMSAATATEIVDDAIARHGWFEAALPETESDARAAAIAALPTLTSVSRASLLAGRLTTGEQGSERKDYDGLTRSAGKIRAALFHKKDVDTRTAGWAISDDVGRAISDRELPAGDRRAQHHRRRARPQRPGRDDVDGRRRQAPRTAACPSSGCGPNRHHDGRPRAHRRATGRDAAVLPRRGLRAGPGRPVARSRPAKSRSLARGC